MRARDYSPALTFGARIFPEDLAGMVGQPVVGDVYYVDATNGSDTNTGVTYDAAFKTLTHAEDVCITNHYDVIIVAPSGTAGTAEVAEIEWDKSYITVVGGGAPVSVSQRSRVVWTVNATDPCLLVSGNGNRFINLQLQTLQVDNNVLVSVTGQRNYFENVHFNGVGHLTAGDDATARDLVLTAASENEFVGCTFGNDTVLRSAANANVELLSGSARNIFRTCLFLCDADATTPIFVKCASTNGLDRFVLFDNCTFINAANAGGSTLAVGMTLAADIGGAVILKDSWMLGVTDLANSFTLVRVAGGTQATAATAGLMVTAA
jgi:hypothetical protein